LTNIKSYALVVTYKVGTTGDIPSTEVLIKVIVPSKHSLLTQEKMVNMIGCEHWFLYKPHIRNVYDSESNLETVPKELTIIKSYALVVTYKGFTTGDIPSTEVLIKGIGMNKHMILTTECSGKHDRLRALFPSKATHQEWV
jgi:hypothetical protein